MKTATLLLSSLIAVSASPALSQTPAASAASAAQSSASAGRTSVSGTSATESAASASRHQISGAADSTAAATASIPAGNTAAASQSTDVAAELTQKIDSRNAKAGDAVVARTTSAAQLTDGTKLPRGTRLLGKVTEAQPKSAVQHDGHLAFAFDRAVLRDGRQIPIHAVLQSISAPATVSAMAGGSDDFAAGGPPIAFAGGGSARASGGLLGGGVSVPHTGLVNSGASAAAAATGRTVGAANAATNAAGPTLGGAVAEGAALNRQTAATVSNVPGVAASSSANGSAGLDAKGNNVQLSSGTQMVFRVAAN